MTFQNVFKAHPKVNEIYVVDNMPFLDKKKAESYASDVEGKVKVVKRKAAKKTAANGEGANGETGNNS